MHEPPTVNALQQAGIDETCYGDTACRLEALQGVKLQRLHSLEEPARLKIALAHGGLACPREVNKAAGRDIAVLCLRPREWLLYGGERRMEGLSQRLLQALDERRTSLLDCSHGLSVIRLSGPAAPWLLSKFSALDFLVGEPPRQYCARTRLGGCAVVIHHCQPEDGAPFVYDLIFDRSVARHLWSLLRTSAPHAVELAQKFAQDWL